MAKSVTYNKREKDTSPKGRKTKKERIQKFAWQSK